VVETPGGWQDFLSQNPGFFRPVATQPPAPAPKAAPPRAEPARPTKLSYKDQRRLAELDAVLAALPETITELELKLADSGLYARDRAGFERLSAALDKARADLAAAEEEWLELESRREALEAGR
jgi:ATP-binding cassette subfamily F protein uup